MTRKTRPTPPPWRYEAHGCESSHGLPTIVKANGHLIAHLCDRNLHNAAFLCEAVNSHYSMAAALIAARNALIAAESIISPIAQDEISEEREGMAIDAVVAINDALHKVRAALAKVKA